ncbi:response regulator [Nitrospirillum sp. BR 11163]|uniref:response regulator n=1 Tax=Nitrospirillum sp. BR 11163 TaxID=3104323 RepID=UPI002AFEC2CF|nr:response regulator [Nitrospirillum sp. BR 11163]MEA1673089.1 response regulator [Nitrospirillum sp. BR 11163]
MMEPELPLAGLRILVADDEVMIALNLEETFREAGAEILSAATVAQAIVAARNPGLSAAVLDVRLGRETSEAVADVLTERGIPFFFYSGQMLSPGMQAKYPTIPVLTKPVRQDAFMAAMLALVQREKALA